MAVIRKTKGMTTVELLIALAVISIGLVYLLGSVAFYLSLLGLEKNVSQANFLAQHSLEALRSFRDSTDWTVDGLGTFLIEVPYHFEKNSSEWNLVEGSIVENGFERKLLFYNVYRDTNDNIVDSSGVLDPDSKRILVIVSWDQKGVKRQIELVTFLTNWAN